MLQSVNILKIAPAVLATGMLWTQPASAGDVSSYSPGEAPTGAPVELRIDLRGHVPARCEVTTQPRPITNMRLSQPGQEASDFSLDCNTPFVLRVRADHGGFVNPAPILGAASVVPYEVSVSLGTDRGRADLGWCDAADLTRDSSDAGCVFAPASPDRGWSSGEATAMDQRGVMRLRWGGTARSGEALYGRYRDVIIVEVEVKG